MEECEHRGYTHGIGPRDLPCNRPGKIDPDQVQPKVSALGTEMESDAGFVIDTPEGIQVFRVLQLKYALSIEIKTGMRHSRGSILKLVNQEFGTSFRTKQEAFDYLEELTPRTAQ